MGVHGISQEESIEWEENKTWERVLRTMEMINEN